MLDFKKCFRSQLSTIAELCGLCRHLYLFQKTRGMSRLPFRCVAFLTQFPKFADIFGSFSSSLSQLLTAASQPFRPRVCPDFHFILVKVEPNIYVYYKASILNSLSSQKEIVRPKVGYIQKKTTYIRKKSSKIRLEPSSCLSQGRWPKNNGVTLGVANQSSGVASASPGPQSGYTPARDR